jgi:hypothetical protein
VSISGRVGGRALDFVVVVGLSDFRGSIQFLTSFDRFFFNTDGVGG